MPALEQGLESLAIVVLAVFAAGWGLSRLVRHLGVSWAWTLAGVPIGLLVGPTTIGRVPLLAATLLAAVLSARSQDASTLHGQAAAPPRRISRERTVTGGRGPGESEVVRGGKLRVGRAGRRAVWIPAGSSHALVVGATGSGKSVTQAVIARRLIENGHGAVVVDPKGDQMLREQAKVAAERSGAKFFEWTPDGSLAYNPYAHGGVSEVADKALAGETFTEPHFQRQAQRYIAQAVTTMRAADLPISPITLAEHLDPAQLEVTARTLASDGAEGVHRYLDSLGERQRRELAGVRDRLSILAESDAAPSLDPSRAPEIDLAAVVGNQDVVYFRLDADSRPLVAAMIGAAIVSDLVTLVASGQAKPVPTVVVIDEFSAVAAAQVTRLFGRARSAGMSLVLGTQELADLKAVDGGALRDQTIGNVAAIIAHRQNVPESAELIAGIAGTERVWIHTEQTTRWWLWRVRSGRGSRTRGWEYRIHPDLIKQLTTGHAAVVTPGSGSPSVARIDYPNEPYR